MNYNDERSFKKTTGLKIRNKEQPIKRRDDITRTRKNRQRNQRKHIPSEKVKPRKITKPKGLGSILRGKTGCSTENGQYRITNGLIERSNDQ